MDVQGLRNHVRGVLDVDEEELPNALLDAFLQDAFERTVALDNRLPLTETTWSLTKLAGESSIALPTNMNPPAILSVRVTNTANTNHVLLYTDHTTAQETLPFTTGTPGYFSVWDNRMYLWPSPDLNSEYQVEMQGYRAPVWTSVASATPDLDPRLHLAMCHYAVSLAYAQQEDEVLEASYYARWERDVSQQLKAINDPVRGHPVVMHGRGPRYPVGSYVVRLPG